jgi:non-ribosomal peptide synthetase component F
MRQLDGLTDRRVARTSPHDGHSTRSKLARFTIDPVEGAALRGLSRRCRVSMATTLLGLLAIVLREMTDSTDIVIGVPVSCRPPNRFEHTVGLFVNLVAVRSDLSKSSDLSALLRRLWSSTLDAYQHRAFPYECLVDALGARTGQGPPPFRVVFNYSLPAPFELVPPDFPRCDQQPRQGPPSFADLSLHTRDTGTSLDCCVVYKSDLLRESEITDFTTRFRRLAGEAARDPDRAVSHLVPS